MEEMDQHVADSIVFCQLIGIIMEPCRRVVQRNVVEMNADKHFDPTKIQIHHFILLENNIHQNYFQTIEMNPHRNIFGMVFRQTRSLIKNHYLIGQTIF